MACNSKEYEVKLTRDIQHRKSGDVLAFSMKAKLSALPRQGMTLLLRGEPLPCKQVTYSQWDPSDPSDHEIIVHVGTSEVSDLQSTANDLQELGWNPLNKDAT